ncbi:hypothetical protein NO995_10125 [Aestuariibaculum sp. M13]|uniref:hypothetical protein n=1 Tax=Aestuariibaculum sp. M13 TaxID=2967132 RepID=UPI002159CAE8|nr:hypothetical protein [Aestuariibaculum sp. M13]MCR8668039.1 hypothetical protein [Aestuariibaculum sp. M13]
MKFIIFKFGLLALFLSFLECEDDLQDPSGIETRVYGRMYDSQNEIPIVGQQLKISEYNRIPGSFYGNTEFIQHLDSTLTNSEGYFDFTFTTSGLGDLYILTYQLNDQFNTMGQDATIEIEDLGEPYEIDFDFTHLYPVNLKITLDSNVQFLPVRINPQFPLYYPSSNNLTQTGVEYTRTIYTNKNSSQNIWFYRTKNDGQGQRTVINLPATNTTDLTELNIYINNDDFVDF